MTQDDAVAAATRWCACAPRWPPWPRRSTTPFRRPGRDDVQVGTRVRAPFHGRTVRGWVVDEEVGCPAGVDLLPLKSWLGWGPPPRLVDLAEWAAWRWAGPASFFLRSASPETIVRALPAPPPRPAGARRRGDHDVAPGDLDLAQAGRHRRAPAPVDRSDRARAVRASDDPAARARAGSVLVLVPSTGWAERLTARLERRGCPTAGTWEQARAGWPVVVGSRAGAWAPVPRLAAAVVLDAHDAAYREESAPTYSAVEVAPRAGPREGVPCLLVSPVPPVALAARAGAADASPRRARRSGPVGPSSSGSIVAAPTRGPACSPRSSSAWPARCSTTRRRASVARWSASTTARAGARLLACRHCGELARCARCGAARGPARGRGGAAVPALRRDPPGRMRGAAAGCA